MTTKTVNTLKQGDWVRFQKDGKLVIGVVQYSIDPYDSEYQQVITDVGTTNERDILETRRRSIDVSC